RATSRISSVATDNPTEAAFASAEDLEDALWRAEAAMSSARSAPGVRTFLTGRANTRTGHPGTPPTWWRSRPGVICRRNQFAPTPGCRWCGGRAAHAQSRSIGIVVVTRFVADDVQLPQLHRRGRRPAARRGASPPHARR